MLAVFTVTSVLTLIAAMAAYQLGYRRALDAGRATLNGLIAAIEKSASIGAYAHDTVLLQEVIDGIAQHELVSKVEVIDPDGRVLVSKSPSRDNPPSSGGEVVHRNLLSPFDRSEKVGEIRVTADVDHMERTAQRDANALAWMFVLQSVVLAVVIYVLGNRLMSQPIVKLAGLLRLMKPGTSEQLIVPKGHEHDEIGSLVDGANALLRTNQEALHKERDLRAQIEKMEAQYRQIFDSSSAGIFVLAHDGVLINCNPTALRVLGLALEDMQVLKGQDFIKRVFARPDRALNLIDEAARCGETVADDLELLHEGDSAKWVHCLISVQGESNWIEGVMYDITERKLAEADALHQAEHDSLTGLRNRAACDMALDHFIAEAAVNHVPVSVLYIDLDGFKQVNDHFGHKAGDQVLIECARRIKTSLRRSSDLVGRVGGDEFVAALYGVGPTDQVLCQVAGDIVYALCQPIPVEGDQVAYVGASVGIAVFPIHGPSRKQVLSAADEAMYGVKHSGKNSFALAYQAVG
ncbi:MAG: diguanylate cyclase [Burkholderiales bacterium]|nr:diguanylate cyclase [Burkholderiales bacterium]MDE2431480.1 diguanylate cyclase [Burkholderiales bacterium]